jgi:putative transcriptional regulator
LSELGVYFGYTVVVRKKEKHIFEPCLMISMPQMQDPNFLQTVSLLSEFNNSGAVALILNRPLQITLHDVLSPDFRKQFDLDPTIAKAVRDTPVYWGGPVDVQQGLILHTSNDFEEESVQIQPNLFITGSIFVLKELLKQKASGKQDINFRFLLGYAGWAAHQLEQEMADSCWMTSNIEKFIFETKPDLMWAQSLQNLGVDISQLASVQQEDYH